MFVAFTPYNPHLVRYAADWYYESQNENKMERRSYGFAKTK